MNYWINYRNIKYKGKKIWIEFFNYKIYLCKMGILYDKKLEEILVL